MPRHPLALLLLAGAAAWPMQLSAADPVAIVEDITGMRDDVQVMDFLEPGRTIALKNGDVLTLGYIATCRRETITGGTVTIGQEKSTVTGGGVSAETIDCGGTTVVASAGAEAGAVVFRKGSDGRDMPSPARTLMTVSPLVHADSGDILKIERLDKQEASRQLVLERGVADLAKAHIRLTRGGLYRLTAGAAEMVVEVDRKAQREADSALERVLVF